MQRKSIINPIVRASLIIVTVIATVTGVTYAALQSQQSKFTGSTIQTATANLQVSLDGSTYSNSQTGFLFSNVIPGGSLTPSTGHTFYLKNAGGTALTLKLAVSSTPTNLDNVDLTKINVVITPISGATPQTFTLQSLIDSNATGGLTMTNPTVLFSTNTYQYTVQVSMARDAFSGSSATIGTIDFSFSGVTVI